eukprot:TRINITY_DN9421_c0_g1_i1.p1 TRINITY_DN9421_c0_g1~~TRINITY_DN9421_c0_g1_i1.p1  ORF type:complete len:311 (+),score=57.86 TRINITY_DN9421_c0_g1_i1:42-935(+)
MYNDLDTLLSQLIAHPLFKFIMLVFNQGFVSSHFLSFLSVDIHPSKDSEFFVVVCLNPGGPTVIYKKTQSASHHQVPFQLSWELKFVLMSNFENIQSLEFRVTSVSCRKEEIRNELEDILSSVYKPSFPMEVLNRPESLQKRGLSQRLSVSSGSKRNSANSSDTPKVFHPTGQKVLQDSQNYPLEPFFIEEEHVGLWILVLKPPSNVHVTFKHVSDTNDILIECSIERNTTVPPNVLSELSSLLPLKNQCYTTNFPQKFKQSVQYTCREVWTAEKMVEIDNIKFQGVLVPLKQSAFI